MRKVSYRLPALKKTAAPGGSGRAKQRSGADFQQQVDAANDWYRRKGLALVDEIPVASVMRRGQLQYAGKRGRVDYMGLVWPVGQAVTPLPIAFDAKVVHGRTFAPAHWNDPKHRQRLALQVQFLLDWEAMGGIGGYLCFDRDDRALYWITPDHLRPFTGPRALAGEMPEVVIREKHRTTKTITAPHPWRYVSPDAAVIDGSAPGVAWRPLALERHFPVPRSSRVG